jgi:hypothetical protein
MAFAPTDIAGLDLWFDAQSITGKSDNDALTSWPDLSGGNHTASEATNAPAYIASGLDGHPVVRFDGSNDRLRIADFDLASTGLTVLALVKITGSGAQQGIINHGDEGDNHRAWMLGVQVDTGVYYQQGLVSADGGNTNMKRRRKSMRANRWAVLSMRFAPGSLSLANNGALITNAEAPTDGTVASLNNPTENLCLGCRLWSTGATYFFAGDMAEVLVYSAALTDDQMQDAVAYLWGRWHTPASIYVATTGSDDTGTGAIDAPYATVAKAESVALPGDSVVLREGTYSAAVSLAYSGAKGMPVAIRGYTGEAAVIAGGAEAAVADTWGTWWRDLRALTLDSAATETLITDAWVAGEVLGGSHHWTVDSCDVAGSVKLYGSYATIVDSEFSGAVRAGNGKALWTIGYASHHTLIDGNTIHDYTGGDDEDANRGVWLGGKAHQCTITGNTIYNIGDATSGMGIDTDGYTLCQYGHQIDHNTCYACGESGIELENTFDSICEYNIVHDCGRKGIDPVQYDTCVAVDGHGLDGDARGQASGTVIRYNLIYDNTQYGLVCYDAAGLTVVHNTVVGCGYGAVDINNTDANCPIGTLTNNIFAVTGDLPVVSFVTGFTGLTTDDYNCLYCPDGDAYTEKTGGTTKTLAEYRAATTNGDHSVAADPMFADAEAHDYSLVLGSPAVGTASDGTNMGYEQTVPLAPAASRAGLMAAGVFRSRGR